MRHIMGNTPKCHECLWYKDSESWEKCPQDGWCTNKKHLKYGTNGHKRERPPDREPVQWNGQCHCWEDAEEPHINHFEAVTHKPDPNRSETEKTIIADYIKQTEEEQARKRREWNAGIHT